MLPCHPEIPQPQGVTTTLSKDNPQLPLDEQQDPSIRVYLRLSTAAQESIGSQCWVCGKGKGEGTPVGVEFSRPPATRSSDFSFPSAGIGGLNPEKYAKGL